MQHDKTTQCADPCKRCQETGECKRANKADAERLAKLKTNLGLLQHGGFINVNPQKAYELEQQIKQLQNKLLNEH